MTARRGRRLTGVVVGLAFVSVCNSVSFGVRDLTSRPGQAVGLRLAAGVGLSALLCAWAVMRLRRERGERAPAVGAPSYEEEAWGSWSDRLPGWLTRAVRLTRWAAALGLTAAAVVMIVDQWATLQSAFDRFGDLDWRWVRWAVYAEAVSTLAYAWMFVVLLRSGGFRLRLRPTVALTLAGNALVVSLPGGIAWAATFSFGQLRRRGVPRGVAVAVALGGRRLHDCRVALDLGLFLLGHWILVSSF